jgi:hypothetical protein
LHFENNVALSNKPPFMQTERRYASDCDFVPVFASDGKLASDFAASCVIVCLRHPVSKDAVMAHLHVANIDSMTPHLLEWKRKHECQRLQLYICGGTSFDGSLTFLNTVLQLVDALQCDVVHQSTATGELESLTVNIDTGAFSTQQSFWGSNMPKC